MVMVRVSVSVRVKVRVSVRVCKLHVSVRVRVRVWREGRAPLANMCNPNRMPYLIPNRQQHCPYLALVNFVILTLALALIPNLS